jgi:hypothetical protein
MGKNTAKQDITDLPIVSQIWFSDPTHIPSVTSKKSKIAIINSLNGTVLALMTMRKKTQYVDYQNGSIDPSQPVWSSSEFWRTLSKVPRSTTCTVLIIKWHRDPHSVQPCGTQWRRCTRWTAPISKIQVKSWNSCLILTVMKCWRWHLPYAWKEVLCCVLFSGEAIRSL